MPRRLRLQHRLQCGRAYCANLVPGAGSQQPCRMCSSIKVTCSDATVVEITGSSMGAFASPKNCEITLPSAACGVLNLTSGQNYSPSFLSNLSCEEDVIESSSDEDSLGVAAALHAAEYCCNLKHEKDHVIDPDWCHLEDGRDLACGEITPNGSQQQCHLKIAEGYCENNLDSEGCLALCAVQGMHQMTGDWDACMCGDESSSQDVRADDCLRCAAQCSESEPFGGADSGLGPNCTAAIVAVQSESGDAAAIDAYCQMFLDGGNTHWCGYYVPGYQPPPPPTPTPEEVLNSAPAPDDTPPPAPAEPFEPWPTPNYQK